MPKNMGEIHHKDWMLNGLPDKSVQLIIADPPYFEVKGDFDFIWASFEDYLKDVERWAVECKRVLADNGTLFWYGHAKKIAYAQVIFDKHFNLENNIVWSKKQCQTMRQDFDRSRCFAPVSERCLMYAQKNDCKIGFEPSFIRDHFQEFLMQEKLKSKLSTKEINKICGYSENTRNKIINKEKNWMFITEESYTLLQEATGFFKKPYKELQNEYELLRRPFNNFKKLFDIMSFDQEAHITVNYDHDTCKPETLTRALILTCSRPNDLVLVPFSGSGTEVAMAIKEGRRAIGFDIEIEVC